MRAQEAHHQPRACTYYYGFTTTHPPFDNLLVRKAFVAATARSGLIQNVTKGAERPALTFTPPGVPGAVDGVAEGVGIPYNPVQARQYLAQAGYPDGQGLPPVTLHFNTSTGHQAIAEYIRQSWQNALGVTVALQDVEWTQYLQQLKNPTGPYQVWRTGWCLDYPDANNFVRDVFAKGGNANPSAGGGLNWQDQAFETAVAQAAGETDPAVRKALYKQAEEILVETDAVIIPIYHYGYNVVAKPYLERAYGVPPVDVAGWRITTVSGTATPDDGGSLTSYDGSTAIQAPAGAFTDTVTLAQAPATGLLPTGSLAGIGHVFDATAVYSDTGQPAQLAPGTSCTVTVAYTDAQRGPVIEGTLGLYAWDGNGWSQQGITSGVDPVANLVTAQVEHFSLFAVLGETRRVYLPVAIRIR
jgi:oligopeptide transport system substrate-binding protein